MSQSLQTTLIFLIQTILTLYAYVIVLRILLQLVHANFYNPVSQFVIKFTDPVLRPTKRFIPVYRSFDISALILLLLVLIIELMLLALIRSGHIISFMGALIWSLGSAISLTTNIFFFAIIIVVVLSWIAPRRHNPISEVLHLLTYPVLNPIKRLIPPLAGIDFSPLIALIALKVLDILVAGFLIGLGQQIVLR